MAERFFSFRRKDKPNVIVSNPFAARTEKEGNSPLFRLEKYLTAQRFSTDSAITKSMKDACRLVLDKVESASGSATKIVIEIGDDLAAGLLATDIKQASIRGLQVSYKDRKITIDVLR